jgi:hypothetical protein
MYIIYNAYLTYPSVVFYIYIPVNVKSIVRDQSVSAHIARGTSALSVSVYVRASHIVCIFTFSRTRQVMFLPSYVEIARILCTSNNCLSRTSSKNEAF